MRRFLISIIAFLTASLALNAQTLSVADVEALPGETVSFAIDLTGGKADTYTAFQFDVQFPASGFTTVGKTISSQWADATGVVGDVDATGLATIAFASAETIAGNTISSLVTISFKVDEGVGTGAYPVTLKNISLGYGTASHDYPDNVTFNVNVVNAHTTVLDEESTTAPTAQTGVNIIVNRTIKAGEWSTLVLPFAMTEEQLKNALGNDVELKDFAGYTYESDEEDNIVNITVNFTSVDLVNGFEANHPYIVRVSSGITSFSVEGVDLNPQDKPTTAAVKRTNKKWSEMVGTYVADTEVPANALFIYDNKFYYSAGKTKMKAMRAYFDFYDVLTNVEDAYAAIKMRIDLDGEATGIYTVDMTERANAAYDISGRKANATQRGLNIINGKKVLVP